MTINKTSNQTASSGEGKAGNSLFVEMRPLIDERRPCFPEHV